MLLSPVTKTPVSVVCVSLMSQLEPVSFHCKFSTYCIRSQYTLSLQCDFSFTDRRMTTKIVFLAAVVLAVLHQIKGQCLTVNDQKTPQASGRKSLYTGEQEFSLKLLGAVNKLNPEENVFFSPYSTYHALLLAYFISGGQTEQFLRKTLRLDGSAVRFIIDIFYIA